MFRDVPLTSEELRFVIEKIVRLFRDVEMSDMPALVYQLLLLSTKVMALLLKQKLNLILMLLFFLTT